MVFLLKQHNFVSDGCQAFLGKVFSEILPVFTKKQIFSLFPLDNNNNNSYYYYFSMNGRKFSAKREEILNLLKSTKSHPGAYWVYERLKPRIPDLSLGTVYRNLNIFCKEGKAAFLGVVRGEERYDGTTEPHPHLVCSHCGAVLDLPKNRADTLLKGYFSVENTFFIDFRSTVFYGLCRGCYKNHKKNSGEDPGTA